MRYVMALLFAALALPLANTALAQDMSDFKAGPVFVDFGPHAPIKHAQPLPKGAKFAHAFDVSTPAKAGQRSRAIESAARFINMHAAAGVDPADMRVAVVVHGKATFDLLSDRAWAAKGRDGPREKGNPSSAMIRAMVAKGLRIILCGQSGAAHGVRHDELIPGVEVALSAMTAHALLQQGGYTVNPF